jgi:Fe-S cluster biogenesis protein NfuA/nitrite reductase/ring-hydroxylating ferredoxin subunit
MTVSDRPTNPMQAPENDTQWRTAGDRIQTLLDSCAGGGAAAHERAQQLVREVVGLYGAGLERIMQLVPDHGSPTGLVERLATDDLVASLLLVHGLHPHDVHRRVSDALDQVRPYLGSHGGDVDLIDITDGPEGARVLLSFKGSCKSCPSSAVTLELAVEDAVRAAAPEISSIEVVAAEAQSTNVIPVESLMAHVHSNGSTGAASWHPVPELAGLESGEVAGFLLGETALLACRVGDDTFAYRDHCPVCDDSLAGAVLSDFLMRCPRCRTHFDVVHAGLGVGSNGQSEYHLDPLPLLARDGVLSIALRPEVTGVPA